MKHYIVMLVLLPVSLWAMDEQAKREEQRELDRQRGVTMRFHEDLVDSDETPSTVLIDLCLGKKVALETAGFCFLN